MTLPREAFRDFCLWPYDSPRPLPEGAMDGHDLLLDLLAWLGADRTWFDIVAALRSELGPHATVWGMKQSEAGLSVELYFYDYARLARSLCVGRVASALQDILQWRVRIDETIPYFMFSFELPLHGAATRSVEAVDLYVGNPGSAVSSGICYRHQGHAAELKSFYFFFERADQWDDIIDKMCCSAQIPMRLIEVDALLPRWLAECRRIVVANKRLADGLYCSGMSAANLARFAGYARMDPRLARRLHTLVPRLEHLLFDAGFDLAAKNDAVVLAKSSFYGLL